MACTVFSQPITVPDSAPQIATDATDSNINWFNGGGYYPPGCYQIVYVQGAVNWNVNTPDTYWSPQTTITDGSGNDVHWPNSNGAATYYSSQSAIESAYGEAVGYTPIPYTHSGGKIGVYLPDGYTADNGPGSPNTTFALMSGVMDIAPGENASPAHGGSILWPIPIAPGFNASAAQPQGCIFNRGAAPCSWQIQPLCAYPDTFWYKSYGNP